MYLLLVVGINIKFDKIFDSDAIGASVLLRH